MRTTSSWIHDYHLMLLARELRTRGHRNRIGFFLHTPCAPPDILQTLPLHRDILGGLTYCDVVGFQTENDRDNFAHTSCGRARRRRATAMRSTAGSCGSAPSRSASRPRLTSASPAPRADRRWCRSCVHSLGGSKLILGVDRLDYSKGIPERIKGFERFLETNPEWHGRVTLLQLTPKSRSDIKQYGEIESEVTGLIGRVNGRFADAAWTPIRYVNRSYSRTVLAGIYGAPTSPWSRHCATE